MVAIMPDDDNHNEVDLKEGARRMWANTGVTRFTSTNSSNNDAYIIGSWSPTATTASTGNILYANLSTSQELAKKRSKHKRKAVIVGIDKYKIEGANLAGCQNDAKDVANTLLVLGFPPTRIQMLINERATKANIIKKLEWLVLDAKPGDVLLYYHSGHGSQKTDIDSDENDRLDEMVIPHDFDWVDQSTHLTDDDFYKYFTSKTPEGVRCEVVFDTCFSGTGTRSLMHSMDGSNHTRTGRYLSPPADQLQRINTMIPAETERSHFGERVIRAEKQQHNTMWAACQEYQVAWELAIDNQIRGAFTYNLCQILRRSNGNKTRRSIYQILRTGMAEEGYEQIPALEVANDEAYDQYPFRRSMEDDSTEIQEE